MLASNVHQVIMTMLPILEQIPYTKKRVCPVEDIIRLLLHPSLNSSKFSCSKVPSSVFKGASFVVDLDSLQNIDDISADDLGVWKNYRVDTNLSRLPWEGAL